MPAPSMIAAHRHHPGLHRGLTLINATADRWGCWSNPGGKIVWAVLRHTVAVPHVITSTDR